MRKVCYNVITFPGSNCDQDALWVAKISKATSHSIWHKDTSLKTPDVVVLPGGFAHGDYLRCGAIAKFSPIMKAVVDFAENGGLVIGICNGFQVLTECGLLPGTLMMNTALHFICQHQFVRIERTDTPFTCKYAPGKVVDFPIAHKDGNYYIDDNGLQTLKNNNQIVFRYCDASGDTSPQNNPNGSVDNIAGIINIKGNVLGLMPHPERASEDILPSKDGHTLFASIIKWVNEHL